MLPLPYCYKITHKETGQFYIGSRCNKSAKHYFQDFGIIYFTSSKTVKELGFENFKIDWIEEFDDPETAYKFEQLIIFESFKDPLCLNKHCMFGKESQFNTIGLKHSEETKRKISNNSKNPSIETRQKMSKARKSRITKDETRIKLSNSRKGKAPPNKGKNHSEETKLKISKSNKGKSLSEEHKEKLRKPKSNTENYKKPKSEEHKAKMSMSSKGKQKSIEHKINISKSKIGNKFREGKTHSEETKLKISETKKNTPKILCVYCNKIFNISNFKRWHDLNCKNYRDLDTGISIV